MTNHADVCYQDVVDAVNRKRPSDTDGFLAIFRKAIEDYFETLPSGSSSPAPQQQSSRTGSPSANWQAIINSTKFGLASHFNKEWDELVAEFPKMNHLARISKLRDLVEPTDSSPSAVKKAWQAYITKTRETHPNLPTAIPARKPKTPGATLETVTTPTKTLSSDDDTPPTTPPKTSTKTSSAAKEPPQRITDEDTTDEPVKRSNTTNLRKTKTKNDSDF